MVLADEPTSMLDVSIRIGILNLMEQMKDELGVSMLYITHDIATARYVAEDLAVMYVGHMVEWGEVDGSCTTPAPLHPAAHLGGARPREEHPRRTGGPQGEIPLWTPESCGCPFAGRCNQAMPRCKETLPPSASSPTTTSCAATSTNDRPVGHGVRPRHGAVRARNVPRHAR